MRSLLIAGFCSLVVILASPSGGSTIHAGAASPVSSKVELLHSAPNEQARPEDERQASQPPLQASRPNRTLIAFLRSPAGIALGVVGSLAAGLGWAVGSMLLLRRAPRTKSIVRGWRKRRVQPAASEARPPRLEVRLVAGILTAGCFLLPLVFSIAFEDVFALPKTAVLWLVAVLAGIVVLATHLRTETSHRPGATDIALAGFVALTAAATIFSPYARHSVVGEQLQYQGLVTNVAYVLLFVAARFAVRQVPQVRLLATALLVAASLAAIYALAQWLSLDPIWDELFKGRVFSTVGQANALAATLGTAAILALALVAEMSRASRAAVVVAVSLVVGALVLTFSRGGYVALAFGLAAALLVLRPALPARAHLRARLPRIGVAVARVAVTLAVAVVVWHPTRDLAARVVARTASIANVTEGSNRAHLDLWAVGIRIAVEHPLLGTGPDSYVLMFPRYRDAVLPADRAEILAQFRPESPHDVYIAVAQGMGIPALGAMLVAIGSVLVAAGRAARRQIPLSDRFAIAGLVGAVTLLLVTNLFMTGEPSTSGIFWVMLGSLAGIGVAAVSDSTEMRTTPAR